jgi:hypothetical protein
MARWPGSRSSWPGFQRPPPMSRPTGWNAEYYGIDVRPEHRAFRCVVEEGKNRIRLAR